MIGQIVEGDLGPFLKSAADLESCKLDKAQLEMQLHKLEAKVTELEEREKHWQKERKIILRRAKDDA